MPHPRHLRLVEPREPGGYVITIRPRPFQRAASTLKFAALVVVLSATVAIAVTAIWQAASSRVRRHYECIDCGDSVRRSDG